MRKNICIVIIVLLTLFNLVSCGRNSLEAFFDEWHPETVDERIGIYHQRKNTILLGNKEIDVSRFYEHSTEKEIDGNNLLFYRLAIVDNILYGYDHFFLKDENGETTMNKYKIYAVDLDNKSVEYLYEQVFPYYADDEGNFNFVRICYSNRNIIMYDTLGDAVRINVDTSEHEDITKDDALNSISKPQYIVSITETKNGEEALEIIKGKNKRIISIDYMAKRNEYVRKISELENYKFALPDFSDPRRGFFRNFTVVNDMIYIICRVLDSDGEQNAVLFSYDYENDKFQFLYHDFQVDCIEIDVIPVVE